jgi:catechol 2,3-dioxygenase
MITPGHTSDHPTEEEIDRTLEESFPASDPPGWTLGLEDPPRARGDDMRQDTTPRPIHPGTRIGHVHLKVADLERALAFYCGVLGFELTQRYGPEAAFVSAGGYHHHIGLNTWESRGGSPPPPGATGLYHVAILYPSRTELADALRRLLDAGIPLQGASDHGVSEALYLSDPDGNGIELYWDRSREQWPRSPDGGIQMVTKPLDLQGLLGEAETAGPSDPAPLQTGPKDL